MCRRRYGYEHRRCESDAAMDVSNSRIFILQRRRSDPPTQSQVPERADHATGAWTDTVSTRAGHDGAGRLAQVRCAVCGESFGSVAECREWHRSPTPAPADAAAAAPAPAPANLGAGGLGQPGQPFLSADHPRPSSTVGRGRGAEAEAVGATPACGADQDVAEQQRRRGALCTPARAAGWAGTVTSEGGGSSVVVEAADAGTRLQAWARVHFARCPPAGVREGVSGGGGVGGERNGPPRSADKTPRSADKGACANRFAQGVLEASVRARARCRRGGCGSTVPRPKARAGCRPAMW
jgi:hypothetical protein